MKSILFLFVADFNEILNQMNISQKVCRVVPQKVDNHRSLRIPLRFSAFSQVLLQCRIQNWPIWNNPF